MRKREAGFTLMEIMVATAIMAILSAIAIPSYIGWLPGHRLRSAVADIRSNLQLVRMRAIKENKECAVFFDPSSDTYQVIDGGLDGSYGNADDAVIKTVTLSEYGGGVKFKNVSFQNDVVVFKPNGLNTQWGYATLVNERGEEARAGAPTLSGVVVCQHLGGGVWQ